MTSHFDDSGAHAPAGSVRLADLVSEFDLGVPDASADLARETARVTDDSRQVEAGAIFVVRRGATVDGLQYVRNAVQAGAVAILVDVAHEHRAREAIDTAYAAAEDPDGNRPSGASPPDALLKPELLLAPSAAALLPHLAERVAGRPSTNLVMVGVTGTNGKTTTAGLIQQFLNRLGLNASPEALQPDPGIRRAGLIGTIAVDDGKRRQRSALTTPPAAEISAMLATMVRNRCSHAVLEVSSHALDQGRTAGLKFDIAVFTNLSGDHLDYHGTMEAYAAAKARLFEQLPPSGVAIINADDPWSQRMVRDTRARVICCRRVRSGAEDADAEMSAGPSDHAAVDSAARAERATGCECTVEVLRSGLIESTVCFRGPWGKFTASVHLPGDHNAMNMLQAVAALWWATSMHSTLRDVSILADCVAAGEAPAGRLQPVMPAADDAITGLPDEASGPPGSNTPTVLVDYAHTDDALANALDSVRAVLRDDQRLGVVFGCGGDRDRAKRPRMARVACDRADFVCLTSDNPRTEDPVAIIGEILTGVPDGFDRGSLLIEPDRRRAIEQAIQQCRAEDVLVIAGKGHEDYQIVGTTRRPFDDRVIAAGALSQWLRSNQSPSDLRRRARSQREWKSGRASGSPEGTNDRSLAI